MANYWSAINIIIYLVILIRYAQLNRLHVHCNRKLDHFLIFTTILFSVFAFCDGDYYHYKDIFETLVTIKDDYTHMEPVYRFLINCSFGNYSLFRLYVWGLAVLFFLKASNNLSISPNISFIILFLIYICTFSYARVTLGMSIAFWGLSILTQNKNIIWGLVVLAASIFFHKTIAFGILAILLAITFHNMTKRRVFFIALVYPLLIVLVKYYLVQFLSFDFDEFETLGINSGQAYLEKDRVAGGIGAKIGGLLKNSLYYLMAFIYIKSIFDGIYLNFSRQMKIVSSACFFIVIISTIFSFDLGYNTSIFYYRLLYFAMIPSTLFLTYCVQNKLYVKLTIVTLIVGILATSYQLLYNFYLQSIGLGI